LGTLGLEAVKILEEASFFLGERKGAGWSGAGVKGLKCYPALLGKPLYEPLELGLDLGEDDPALAVSQSHHGA